MKSTLKDIAREAGLSISAVSLVLNDRPCRISEVNKERIRAIARKHNYTANQVARSLVSKCTRMLALILPDIENIFFSSLAKHIEEYCRQEDYALIITNTNDRYDDERSLLKRLAARGVDGIFLIVSNESYRDNTALLKELKELSIPYVMVDRIYPELECDRVYFNNKEGGYRAVRHLLEHGHRKIACVTSPISYSNGRARLSGYLKAMEEYGCKVHSDYLEEGDYRFDSGYNAAGKLLKTDVTAAFICNDMMALGFLKRLYQEGLRIPQDFSLVGYDNLLSPFLLGVELTSVSQDVERLAACAGQMLLKRLGGDNRPPRSISLLPELSVRDSVKTLG